MTETDIQRDIQRQLSKGGTRLFRNSVGVCNCRGATIRYGIPGPGGSDLIGWQSVTITPEMVGTTYAVFLSVEVKKPGCTGKPEQITWLSAVTQAGGFAGIARSVSDAKTIIFQN